MKVRQMAFRSALILILCSVGFMYSQSESVFQQVEEAVAASVKQGVQVGNEAKSFELHSLRGETVSLNDFHGTPVVINFFATWCPPCQEEMPVIVELEKRLTQKGAKFIAVNMTSQEASIAEVEPFLKHFNASFDVLLDETGEVMNMYQIIGIPTTVVIDENGVIVQRINGGLSYSMMEDLYLFRQ
ncbi:MULTISPECIES: TlpA disulfide reductase family protein [Alkalihalophilus]|uniref:TlpA disulfide reductase family protein n=1 Tax=Alkalihalophilus pseudofirmus TaxID=79885 RepID=A0AAJ2NNI8_ALKPS|nr:MULTISPECIES: TlpA disulfide reductase family protein [Alkalihalophilus]MDV2885638.1 TlpA disulfide reductase family protein [Alkalihalophilus pseudofirmus]MEC2074334.1 TlpA disulfide reductase family protein [Alkalihalophilus marmarensis]OLS39490.1 alkyl hydroperoxide reductase [Alkalihalophilus pseudofirmus]WEG15947.1 TlpA disulfide reductase family protein [Alkalihalophilus pseudofirmus]